MTACALILLGALVLDSIIGDPKYPLHPVRLIGKVITLVEKAFRSMRLTGIFGGTVFAGVILAIALGSCIVIRRLIGLAHSDMVILFDGYCVYSFVAMKDLMFHAKPVAAALEERDLESARSSLQKMVGRDVSQLDEHGVIRAAVESVSENFPDAILAPLFWYMIGAVTAFSAGYEPLPSAVGFMLVYKAVNTLDSMVGYRNERYLQFGRASARLDDLLNFIPSRLSVLFLLLAAPICKLSARKGWQTALRDRLQHASPNSGHAESFAAGALELRLGGPAVYPHGIVDKPWLGQDIEEPASRHILSVCRLVLCAGWIFVFLSTTIMLVMG